jgi:4-amino-4-deoxychorismate lyase
MTTHTTSLARRGMLASTIGLSMAALPVRAEEPATVFTGSIDGAPPSAADLRRMALANYGHFTTMRVRQRSVQGLDFQIERLQRSTRLLFNADLAIDRVLGHVRDAAPDDDAMHLVRINIFPRTLDWMKLGAPMQPGVLVTRSVIDAAQAQPQAVKTVQHERVLPEVKHVGTFGLFHHRRLAQAQGFDDALFFDARRSVSEGTTWNVGFFDGQRVVLPTAPALPGGAIHLLRHGMRARGIPFVERDVKRDELDRFELAFMTNVPETIQPLKRIDAKQFPVAHPLYDALRAGYGQNSWHSL